MDGALQIDGTPRTLYDRDFAAWALDQAARLRQAAGGADDALDWLNLAEEIEALARRDRRELASHIRVVAEHLMKLEAFPATDPRAGWKHSVAHGRGEIAAIIEDSLSLGRAIGELVLREMPRVRTTVATELADRGETPQAGIDALGYTPEQITGDWWPA